MIKRKDYTVLLISVLAGICIWFFMPAANGLTDLGVRMLTVFIPTIILWLFCDTGWTGMLSCIALAALGVMKGDTVFMTMWGNSVVFRVICLSIMTGILTENGGTRWIARWFVSRKICHGHPYIFMFMTGIVGVVLGFVVSPPVIVLLFISLNEEVATSIGYDRKSKFYKACMLISLWCASWSDVISPFGRTISSAIIALMANYGYDILATKWLSFTVPFAILGVLVQIFIIKAIYKPDISNFEKYDDAGIRQDLKDNPMNAKAKFVIFCILATIILWLVPSLTFLPGSVTAYFNQMGTGVAVHFMLILLILVPVGGQPVTNYAKIFSYVPWKLMPFLGAIIIYSGYMGSDTYGIKALLINLLGPVVSNMSLIALLIIALFICIVVTNFVSNTVAATIVTSVFVPLVASFSGATTNLLMLLAIAVSCIADSACCTLAGSVTAGVAFDDNVVPYSEGIKPCIAYSAVLTAVTCVLLLGMGLFL